MAKYVQILSGTINLVLIVTKFITYLRETHSSPKKIENLINGEGEVQIRAGGGDGLEKFEKLKILGEGSFILHPRVHPFS